jgi:cell division septal protein FtsQ
VTPARDNAAYDLSLFESKEDREERKVAEEPAKRVKTATKSKIKTASAARWVAMGLFIVLSLVAIMLCNVQLTALNEEISTAQTKLGSAQSDEIRLNMQLESRMALDNIENYAVNQMGLQKASQYQITYVHMTDKDKVDVMPKNENVFTKLFNFILEYL